MSNYAKGLQNVSSFVRRFKEAIAPRLHRILDDRDNVLAEAMKNMEARSDSNYPAVLSMDNDLHNLSVGGSALTGIVITGTNLLGDSEQATGSTSLSAGEVSFEAIRPGEQTITITITEGGTTLGVTADAAAGTIAIVHGSGGSGAGGVATATELAAAVNTDAEAKFMVEATVETAGDIDADETVTVTTSGPDPGGLAYATLGDVSMDGDEAGFGFTAWTNTAITMDIDPTTHGAAAGEMAMFRLWIDDVLVLQFPAIFVT